MKKIIIITGTSFTVIILLFALLSTFDMAPTVSNAIVAQVFVMASSIAVFMSIAEKVQDKMEVSSLWIDALIRVCICYITVFLEGCVFGMFDFSWNSILKITIILIPTYIITYAAGYFICLESADAINSRIKHNK